MNNVLVDSSVWISYFRGDRNAIKLNQFLDSNQVVINNLILAELLPFLKLNNQTNLINLMNLIKKVDLSINWNEIIELQYKNIQNGINKVGIPDLIILQSALQNDFFLFTYDKHFELMSKIFPVKMI
jgi:predicted nucleic acid-binding protein